MVFNSKINFNIQQYISNRTDFTRTKTMINFKILPKRIPTNEEGIFYKQIINDNGKEVDKAYIIRY